MNGLAITFFVLIGLAVLILFGCVIALIAYEITDTSVVVKEDPPLVIPRKEWTNVLESIKKL